jgi:two-component system, response regulator YesN
MGGNMEIKNVFKVLIAEDEELILNNIVKKVNSLQLGFEVIATAQDGKQAMKLINKLLPDLIITDIKMPVMDGLELLKNVDSKFPYIKKIVLSGFNDFSFAKQAMKCHVDDYLLKPIKINELTKVLTRNRLILENERKLIKCSLLDTKNNHLCSGQEIAEMIEAYVIENYTKELNFDIIAQKFNFNSSYLSKIFTKYIGENPVKYLTALRINKAKHLLLNNKDMSIKEIGEQVGYSDQFYFSRIFKNVTGISPASYKQKQN